MRRLIAVFSVVCLTLAMLVDADCATFNNCTTTPEPATPAPSTARQSDNFGEILPVLFVATFNSTNFADRWADNTTVSVSNNTESPDAHVVHFSFNQDPYYPEGRAAWAEANDQPATPEPTAADVSSSTAGNTNTVNYNAVSYIVRFRRETYLIELDRHSAALRDQYGMTSLTYTIPTKPVATTVPTPIPSLNEVIPGPGTLRFFIRFREAYHYTDPESGKLQIITDPYAVGPNITGISDKIADIVGITDAAQYDRIRFIQSDVNIPQNRYLRMLWNLQPSSYLASFEVDGQSTDTPSTSQIYQRLYYMQSNGRQDLCNLLEGCMEIDWQPIADIITFDAYAKRGAEEYLTQKIYFTGVLMVVLLLNGIWLGMMWVKSKSSSPN